MNDILDRQTILLERATDVLGDRALAERWLRTPIAALGSNRPIEAIQTAEGFERCMVILGRIEHGVFS